MILAPWIWGIIATAVAGALWLAYDTVDGRGYARAKAECVLAEKLRQEEEMGRANLAATEKEQGDAKSKVVYRTIEKTVDRYIDRPVYRSDCFDPDGLRDANRALGGPEAPAGQPDQPVPRSDPAGGREGGDGAEEAGRGG